MSQQTVTSLEQETRRIFQLFDAMDTSAIAVRMTDDVQGVDEISRGWMRGRAALEAYFGQLQDMVGEVHTDVSDLHSASWGDAGVVTCVLDQTYTLEGEEQKVTAPTTLVFRREGDLWKLAVIHTVPLSEPEA